jgi:O-antigen/teichoic acid export membrane protein
MIKNISILGFGSILKYILAFFTFILLARYLQVKDYGIFLTITSIVGFFSAFADWGSYSLIIKDLKNDLPLDEVLGSSIFLTLIITPILIFIIFLIKLIFFTEISFIYFLLISIAELLGTRFGYLAGAIFLAKNNLKMQMLLDLLSGILKFILVLILPFIGNGIFNWSVLYSIGTITIGVISLLLAMRYCNFRIKVSKRKTLKHLKEGSWFALSQSAQSIYFDFNNTSLSYLKGIVMAGVYGAAFRFIGVALMALGPIATAFYPKFFEVGKLGYLNTIPLCKYMLKFTLSYSLIASIFLFSGSYLLPIIIGNSYYESSTILRWMIPILILQSLYIPFFHAMNASNLQKFRTIIQFISVSINAILCLLLIPFFSWKGAIIATIISQIYIILKCFIFTYKESNSLSSMRLLWKKNY